MLTSPLGENNEDIVEGFTTQKNQGKNGRKKKKLDEKKTKKTTDKTKSDHTETSQKWHIRKFI